MDFKQIEAFVNVVRYKSFSKAADASFFSQPTISTHIQNLEKELGVRLLDRKSRSVEPTAQGNAFYEYAIEMLNVRARAFDAIGSAPTIGGIIEILSSSIPSVTFLPDLMAEFKSMNEDVQYYLSVSDTENVVESILQRRGEIGFIGAEIKNALIETYPVSEDKSVLIAPPSYKIGKNISLEDCFAYPFIWRESGSATRDNFEKAVRAAGYDAGSIKHAAMVDNIDAVIRSVEAGIGVAVISEKVADALGDRVTKADIKDFEEKRSFYMIQLKRGSLSPAAAAFAQFVMERS